MLITSVTVARARAARQWADADRRLAAARSLDAMVARWLDGPTDAIPTTGGGNLDGAPGCTWRATATTDPAVRQLGSVIVRIDVRDERRTVLTLELLKRLDPRREEPP